MIVAVCIDDRNGMTFYGKRPSWDGEVIKDFMSLSGGRVLVAPFSAELFEDYDVIIDNNLLRKAKKGDYCFIENKNIAPYAKKIEKIYIYKWNEAYPSDKKLEMPDGFRLEESVDFEGYAHKCITRLTYVRGEDSDER